MRRRVRGPDVISRLARARPGFSWEERQRMDFTCSKDHSMIPTMTLGIYDELRSAIEKSPKRRYVIATEAGIHESMLSLFMKGERGLSVESLEKIAESLGYSITLKKQTKAR